jgi:hypothetical protein
MPTWDAKQFARELLAGKFNGKLHQMLRNLSNDQLKQILEAAAELSSEKSKPAEENKSSIGPKSKHASQT